MDTRQDELRRDLDAALQTRKELGEEYESEIVDSFLARLDARLDARVERRVAERLDGYGPAEHLRRRSFGRSGSKLPLISLVLGIPLTGIATSGSNGFMGLLVCWAGIVGVNYAAIAADRREEKRARPPRGEWD
ncbi:hypothetical protein OG618_15300 [Kitasatospora sp. NBC_01246]|uniref:hypothetical protein n=1 Tax=Kitasatospora sp. NBC_01246 TaxID=2903570 RepID=UPI002E2F449D|nr:hypothetical protein [Kitasatospora sp. NBC_01246]